MALDFAINIGINDQEKTRVKGTLSDQEEATLQQFLDQYDRLSKSRPMREGVPCHLEAHWSKETGELKTESVLPCTDDLSILLHELRPFLLQDEPATFYRAANILSKTVVHEGFRAAIGAERKLYDGRDTQSQMTVSSNGEVVNSQQVFDDWINSAEYHRDQDRKQSIDSLLERVPGPLFYGLIVSLLIDKTNAIGNIASLASLVLGRTRELRGLIPA